MDPELFSYPDTNPSFQLVSDPDPTWIFSNILKINFTYECTFCKCVRLHYDEIQVLVLRDIFLLKGIYNFKLSIFVAKLSNCISNFRVVLQQIHFESGAIWIRFDFFRICFRTLLRVSDPTGSGKKTAYRYTLHAHCTHCLGWTVGKVKSRRDQPAHTCRGRVLPYSGNILSQEESIVGLAVGDRGIGIMSVLIF